MLKINFTEPLKDHCKFSNGILLAIARNSLRNLPKTELNKNRELLIEHLFMPCKLKKESSYLAFLKKRKSLKAFS